MKILFTAILLMLSVNASSITHTSLPQKQHKARIVIEITDDMMARLSNQDRTICTLRANVGADALKNAKAGATNKENHAALIQLALSRKFESLKIPMHEIDRLFKIVDAAHAIHKKYPQVQPVHLGNKLWGQCVYTKSAILAKL